MFEVTIVVQQKDHYITETENPANFAIRRVVEAQLAMRRAVLFLFQRSELSEEGLAFLRQGFCVDDDPYELQISAVTLPDSIYDSGEGPDLEVPESFWDTLGVSAEVRTEMENIWAFDPDHDIQFI